MGNEKVAPQLNGVLLGDRLTLITPAAFIVWFSVLLGLMTADQLSHLPPRPPTNEEVMRATPEARKKWQIVFIYLQNQLEPWQPRPPLLGAVWSTRNGEICGIVDEWHTGVDVMTPFYTIGARVFFKDNNEDDMRRYVAIWPKCVMDPWVVLHQGSLNEGACAAPPNREFCSRRR